MNPDTPPEDASTRATTAETDRSNARESGDRSAGFVALASSRGVPIEWLVVYLKGACMGAADVVPGVSGATIALITGIYERLITAITNVDPRAFRPALRPWRPAARATLVETLRRMDAAFLAVLGLGIVSAVVVLSRVMYVATQQYPVPTYGFFFGLIGASAIVLYGEVDLASVRRLVVAVLGITVAALASGAAAGDAPHSAPMILLTGAVAICAMVLPGVSGAFFLLVLGQYEYLTGTLSAFVDALLALPGGGPITPVVEHGTVVATFGVGAVVGLFSMAHLVKRALERYRAATLTFLVSLMVGGLRLPAERVAESVDGSSLLQGATLVEALVALAPAIVAGVFGATLVFLVDRYTEEIGY